MAVNDTYNSYHLFLESNPNRQTITNLAMTTHQTHDSSLTSP